LLLSDDFTSYAIAGSDRAGMPKVNQTHLFKYQLSLPSIKSQKIAVQTIDLAMEKSELLQADYRSKLQDISDLRQSLLQKAFAGELT
jgi:type I restriction enzyme S subunit